MLFRVDRWVRIASFAALAALAVPGAASSAERREKPKGKKVKALGQWTFDRLSKAHELLSAEKYAEALAVLDEISQRRRLNEHERALLWQTYAYVQSSQERYAEAIDSFEKCLATDALPEQAAANTHYNLGQLYLVVKNYPEAIRHLRVWFESVENPAPSAHFILAMAYVQNDQKSEALPHAEQAVRKASEPKESWLQLLLALYFETKRYADAVDVLKQLVERFPKKNYFLQLSAAYSELERSAEAMAVLELARMQGLLDKDSEYRILAQLYLQNDLPYRAATLLDEGIASGVVQGNADAWSLLADSWLNARERSRALAPLERAAKESEGGELYVRLAQIQVDEENWNAAEQALGAALRKGKLEDPGKAQLLLGVVRVNQKKWKEAEQAFASAQQSEATRDAATKWLKYLPERIAAEPGGVNGSAH